MESSLLEKSKPYIAMICLQFGYAGMNIVTKVSLNSGMSHFVLVVYRNAFATVAIAPFAFLLERKVRPKMTFPIFMQIFLLGLLGPVVDQNFYYAGLKYTSPVFASAMSNTLPAITFVLAILFRLEKIEIKNVRWQAKVVGTLVTVGGAMLMAFYKGSYVINMFWFSHPASSTVDFTDSINGSIHLIIAAVSWAAFFILQAVTLRNYPAQLSLATLVCFLGTLQSMALTFVMEHKPSVWIIGFDMNLFAAAYAGIISSGVAYYVQGLVMQKRGPVFVTTFTPITLIIVAFMSSILLGEVLYIAGVLGALLIVMGMYAMLWGEYKEKEEQKTTIPTTMIKIVNEPNYSTQMVTIFEDNETEDTKSQNNEDRRIIVIAVNALQPESPMIAMEAPKGQR